LARQLLLQLLESLHGVRRDFFIIPVLYQFASTNPEGVEAEPFVGGSGRSRWVAAAYADGLIGDMQEIPENAQSTVNSINREL
jgi:hypothetical protein